MRHIRLPAGRDREDGFTLIELMVVVLIIAILISIAIPSFLGARQKAQNSAAKSDLRNALVAAKSFYSGSEDYSPLSAAILEGEEPSLDYVAVASADKTHVGFGDVGPSQVVMVRQSKAGAYFCIAESAAGGTTFGKSSALANVDTVAECTGGW